MFKKRLMRNTLPSPLCLFLALFIWMLFRIHVYIRKTLFYRIVVEFLVGVRPLCQTQKIHVQLVLKVFMRGDKAFLQNVKIKIRSKIITF